MTETPQARQRARAYGLDIDAAVPVAGLPAAGPEPSDGRSVRLDLVVAADIRSRWTDTDTSRLLEDHLPGDSRDRPAATVDMNEQRGYRFAARGHGLAGVSSDGSQVAWAPAPGRTADKRDGFLLGRVLPWVCVLRGYEAVHASAVSINGRAVAIAGPSGSGKTSLALALVAHGAELVTDDVLAVRRVRDGVRAYPGPAAVNVADTSRRFGPALIHNRTDTTPPGGKTMLPAPVVTTPVPLAAMCFLDATGGPAIEPSRAPDPRRLLASTYVIGMQRPDRLTRQLDLYALIAAAVPAFDVRTGAGLDVHVLAERLWDALLLGTDLT